MLDHVKIDRTLNEILISLPDKTIFNLSSALKNADLTQLNFSQELLDRYQIFLRDTKRRPDFTAIKQTQQFAFLHPAVLQAINIYTSPFYRVINKLCRGEIPEDMVIDDIDTYASPLVIEALFVAAFASYGLNQCQLRLADPEQPQLPPTNTTLHRRISHAPKTGFFYREPGILSTTLNSSNSPQELPFHLRFKSVTFDNLPFFPDISCISEVPDEREVAFPAGTIVRYAEVPTKDGTLAGASEETTKRTYRAEIVRTYDILNPNGDNALVGEALRYAFVKHLNHPYSGEEGLSGAPRPNHGVVHTARTLAYVEKVIEYFHSFSLPKFTEYFYKICPLKTKIALTFYSTGRDNEKSFLSSPDEYKKSRTVSAKHFRTYVNELHNRYVPFTNSHELSFTEAEIQWYQDVLKNCGNPGYATELMRHYDDNPQDASIYGLKIALWYTLTLSHCLDLARSYRASRYEVSTRDNFSGIIEDSVEQKNSLNYLRSFAIKALHRTNDNCLCGFDNSGTLVDVPSTYCEPEFERLSFSFRDCEEVINTFIMEERYESTLKQSPSDEDPDLDPLSMSM